MPAILQHLAYRASLHLSRRLAPVLGARPAQQTYAPIRDAFAPANVTAAGLTLDATSLDTTAHAATVLDRHGVVVLRDFLSPEAADAARAQADILARQLNTALAGPGDHGETNGVQWQVAGACFASHAAILAQGRPLANIRSRERGAVNGGIIDLFFVDAAARAKGWDALASCCARLNGGAVARIVATVSPARPAQVNLLRNESVTVTRRLHVDNLGGSYKAFLYLSDVRTMADGPYAYVPGSHRRPDLLRREARLNCLKGRSETDSFAFDGYEIPFLVEKGTLIISCQSGVHRGMPQQPGASRTVLVGNYRR